MRIKRVLLTTAFIAAFGFAGTAMAESKKSSAPGQTGMNPGQEFKNTPGSESPGQQFKIEKATPGIDATPPGQDVQNWGNTKPPKP